MILVEKCNECGRSVKIGSGLFVGRVIDLNDVDFRKYMNKPFPEGDFICLECDEEIRENDRSQGITNWRYFCFPTWWS